MKSYLEKTVGPLDNNTLKLLSEITTDIEVTKDKFLLEEGQSCKHLWF